MKSSIHKFQVKSATGKEVNLSDYKGKVLLVVNTASKCGLTPQYGKLEELYKEYRDKGLEILGFPSNDFMGQEPLNSEGAAEFCQINYGVSFPIMEKSHVTGKEQNQVFKFLSNKSENGKVNIAPKWNFQKYLVNKNGEVVDFFLPTTEPNDSKVKKAIEKLIAS